MWLKFVDKPIAARAATVEWAGAVLNDMRALLTGAGALRSDKRSHLRLAASFTVAEYLIPGWLQHVANDLPHVGVSLEMANIAHVAEMVAKSHVDLGFIEGPRPPGHLRAKDLGSDELVIVVGRGHPWSRRRRNVTAIEVASTPILLRESGSGTRDVLTAALAEQLGSTTAIKARRSLDVGRRCYLSWP
jgi:DNA-binding transcriptional LysR family regulator